MASPSNHKYKQISDLTTQMVTSGELTPAEQLQVHRALSAKGYGPGVPSAAPPPLRDATPQQPTGPDTYMAHLKRFVSGDPTTQYAFPDRGIGSVLNYPFKGLDQAATGAGEVAAGQPMAGVN